MFNEAVFQAVSRVLAKETDGRAGQPQLIVGAPGSGKTFLIRRLIEAFATKPGLSLVWIDGRMVFSTSDILGEDADERIILFVDDFQYYLQRATNADQFVLRGILSRRNGPILVATVPTLPPQLTEYGAAFFESFRIHYLKPLSDKDIQTVLECLPVQYERARALMDYLPRTPQSAFLVRDILKKSESADKDVNLLVEHFSPSCRKLFDGLLSQQQRILCAIAGETSGLKLSGIRDKTGQEAGTLSPYITQMVDKGLITRKANSIRGGTYRIADPLLDLWLSFGPRNVCL